MLPDIFDLQPNEDNEDDRDNPGENVEDQPENMESDSEVEGEVNDSNSYCNTWEQLRVEVGEPVKKPYTEQVPWFLGMGKFRDFAENAAFKVLLPLRGRKLLRLYLQHLKLADCIRHDELHQDVRRTPRRFINNGSMD